MLVNSTTSTTSVPQKLEDTATDETDTVDWLAIILSILSLLFAITILIMVIQHYTKKALKRDLANLIEKKSKVDNKGAPTSSQLEIIQEGQLKEAEVAINGSAEQEGKKTAEPGRSILKHEKEKEEPLGEVFSPTDLDTFIRNFYTWISTLNKRCKCGQTISKPEELKTFDEFLHRLLHLSPNLNLQKLQRPEILAKCFVEMILPSLGISLTHWEPSSVFTELECLAVQWVGKMINLPEQYLFKGVLQSSSGGGCFVANSNESLLLAVLSARTKKINDFLVKKDELFQFSQNMDSNTAIAIRTIIYGDIKLFPQLTQICHLASIELHPVDTEDFEKLQKLIKKDVENGFNPGLIVASFDGEIQLKRLEKLAKENRVLLHLNCNLKSSERFLQFSKNGSINADTVSISTKLFTVLFTHNKNIFQSIFSREDPSKFNGKNFNMTEWGIHERRQAKGVKMWLMFLILGAEFLSKNFSGESSS